MVSLADSLATVDTIEVDANFAGTWKDLDLNMNTNLGQIFYRATQDAIAGQMLATKQQLTDKIEQAHLQQSLELRARSARRRAVVHGLHGADHVSALFENGR